MALATRQKLLSSEKDNDWKKNTVEYIYERCRPNNEYLRSLYKAANGELDISDYNYIINPYGSAVNNRPELQNYPAKLRNYPIIPEIVQLLLGEKRDRPILASVIAINPDTINRKKAEEVIALKGVLQQIFINTLNELGMDTSLESKPTPPLDQFLESFNNSWADNRSIIGQQTLDYIIETLDIPEKFIQGFKDWVVTGTVFTLKDVINDDVIYRTLDPLRIGFIADSNTQYVEDAEAVCVEEFLTKSSFLDRYWSLIKETIIENIEDKSPEDAYDKLIDTVDDNNSKASNPRITYFGSGTNLSGNLDTSYDGNLYTSGFFASLGDTVKVAYVNWTSMKLIKKISIVNELGEQEVIEVPDDYVVEAEFGEELIEEYWVNEKWEGYVVDDNKYYFGVQPIPIQRNMINNKSACKNLINGRIRRMGDRKAISIVELLMPFQHLYNFVHYKLNNILAKNKDKLMLMPMGLIPDKDGWDLYTSLYYADSTGIMFIDESNDQAAVALNALKAIDLSLGNYIEFMYKHLQNIKMEAENVVGINPQRKAAISAGDGLGTTQTAISQSNVITADLFEDYEKFQERELNGLLDISRFAYLHGKKAAYINSVGRTAFLEITAEDEDFCNAEFGVKVTSSAKEKEKFDKMKIFAETLASQKVKPATLAAILNAESNFSNLVKKLEEIDAQEQELLNQQSEAEAEAEARKEEVELQKHQDLLNVQYYKIDQDNDTKIQEALISADTALIGLDMNNNGIPDSTEVEKNQISREKNATDASIKLQELREKQNTARLKAQTEKYKADISLKIAKENQTAAELKAKKKNG